MIDHERLERYPITRTVFEYIKKNDFLFLKTIDHIFKNFDEEYLLFCEELLSALKKKCGTEDRFIKSMKAVIKLSNEFLFLQVKLSEDGRYLHSSFDEVNETMYQSEKMNEYYLDGLFLSQILWPNHYRIGRFFLQQRHLVDNTCRVLDVPCGTGIYSYYVARSFDYKELVAIDISPYSASYTEDILRHSSGRTRKTHIDVRDIYEFDDAEKFGFIVCGELIEHVNDPERLLDKLKGIMEDRGRIFLTTAIYAASIDHIYLFNNVGEVKDMLGKHFRIISELVLPTSMEKFRPDMNKVPINYACVLEKLI